MVTDSRFLVKICCLLFLLNIVSCKKEPFPHLKTVPPLYVPELSLTEIPPPLKDLQKKHQQISSSSLPLQP